MANSLIHGRLVRTFLLLFLLPLAACSSASKVGSVVTPYKIDVRQGNYVTQDMVAQLKLGMSRDQVKFVLGSPLVADMFHADRWDYIYRFQSGKGELQQRRLVVFFEDEKLARLSGDIVAGESGAEPVRSAPQVIEIQGPAEKGKKGK